MKYLFLLSFLLISCASKTEPNPHINEGVSPELSYYYEDFKLNHKHGNKAIETPIPVSLSFDVQSFGVCYLRYDLKDREVVINRKTWNEYKEKRGYIFTYLLNACYGTSFHDTPHYKIHLNGI